jgi:recombinational DNA repair ATPase RecF
LEWAKKKLLVGPHLDDLIIQSKQGSFTQNASMGQQKMAFLSLQFSLLDHFLDNPELHDPIMLLYDISSEFDGIRWKNLIEYLRSYPIQMMITTARDSADFLPLKASNFKIIYLNDGRVTNST